jgi:hypothetical protein
MAMSFTDAAEMIFRREGRLMSPREITEMALAEGLIATEGKTPASTMGANFHLEGLRKAKQGKKGRFVRFEKGKWGLRDWLEQGRFRLGEGARARW